MRAQSKPPARAVTGSQVPLITIDTGPVAPRPGMARSTSSGGAPASTPADRRSRDMLGLPPTMWIAVGVGVVLAITLAVMLWLKQR